MRDEKDGELIGIHDGTYSGQNTLKDPRRGRLNR